MKIDHLLTDINGTGILGLAHLEPKAAIKGQHFHGVLHRKSNVIEAADAPSRLRRCARATDD